MLHAVVLFLNQKYKQLLKERVVNIFVCFELLPFGSFGASVICIRYFEFAYHLKMSIFYMKVEFRLKQSNPLQ